MRVTRAALRAQAESEPQRVHEDNCTGHDDFTELHHKSSRPALKDITDANLPDNLPCDDLNELTSFKGKDWGLETEKTENIGEATPEEQGSETGAYRLNNTKDNTMNVSDMAAVTLNDNVQPSKRLDTAPGNPSTPTSKDVLMEHPIPMQMISKTPRFDPYGHEQPTDHTTQSEEDSFLKSIKTRSPLKISPLAEEQDSFVEQITARSPSKPVARIEDSVEQLDALEDAIEQIAEELPNLVAPLPGPMHKKPATPKVSAAAAGPKRTPSGRIMSARPAQSRPSVAKVQSKNKVANPATADKKKEGQASSLDGETAANKRKIIHGKLATTKPGFVPAKSSKPATKSTFALPGEAVAEKLKAQREARLARMEANAGQRKVNVDMKATPNARRLTTLLSKDMTPKRTDGSAVKKISKPEPNSRRITSSGKPPTIPSFTLPGDAVAAKLKNQREQRAQRGVETTTKTFKARPVPTSKPKPGLIPRQNKASQARLSVANKENIAPNNDAIKRTSVLPNSSARRVTSGISTSHEKINAEKNQPQMTKQEREEAAKRARAEAAERGRAASRDWAEKQKKKLTAACAHAEDLETSDSAVTA